MKKVLALTAAAEAGTGLVLLVYPPILVRLLFGGDIGGVGIIITRLAGIALVGLGVACWPDNSALQPLHGMLTYSAFAMLYLIYVGVHGRDVGLLLWPVIVVHAIFVVLLVRARSQELKTRA